MDAQASTVVRWHVTVLSNFVRGYDKYARTYSKAAIPESRFADRFFLLPEEDIDAGVRKAGDLLQRLAIPGNRLLALKTRVPLNELRPNTRSHTGEYVEQNHIRLDGVAWVDRNAPSGSLTSVTIEEAMALSLQLRQGELHPYRYLRPRTFSILPIARGCQASCPFCFSAASASAEQEQARLDVELVRRFATAARARGAERFVITGGGEPGLVRPRLLLDYLAAGRQTLGKTVLISNGHHLAKLDDGARRAALADYHAAGLSVLAVSRHHYDEDSNTRAMSLATDAAAIAAAWRAGRDGWPGLRLRFTCVLQRGGIDSPNALAAYVDWAAALGVPELCFKELYVSTSVESVYHRHAANEWSHANQVPLSLVLDFAASHGFVEESRLPWGAPVFAGSSRGRPLRIAAYTEPSLLWERTQGVARSWNLMADGLCLASLEDRDSAVSLEEAA